MFFFWAVFFLILLALVEVSFFLMFYFSHFSYISISYGENVLNDANAVSFGRRHLKNLNRNNR